MSFSDTELREEYFKHVETFSDQVKEFVKTCIDRLEKSWGLPQFMEEGNTFKAVFILRHSEITPGEVSASITYALKDHGPEGPFHWVFHSHNSEHGGTEQGDSLTAESAIEQIEKQLDLYLVVSKSIVVEAVSIDADTLIEQLFAMKKKHPGARLRLIAESAGLGQIENDVGGLVYSERDNAIIILPRGF